MADVTPGEWRQDGLDVVTDKPAGRPGPKRFKVGSASMSWKGTSEAIANARLFAASKELLAAAELARGLLLAMPDHDAEAVRRLDAIIARATGDQ